MKCEEWTYVCEVCEQQFIDPDETKDHMFAFHVNMVRVEKRLETQEQHMEFVLTNPKGIYNK